MAHPAKTLSVHSDEDESSSGAGIQSKQEAASEIAGRIVLWKQGRNTAARHAQSLAGRRAGATPGQPGGEQRVARIIGSAGAGSYSAAFAALLRNNAATGDIARIKSPAFAASLSHRERGTRRRSIALGTALACVLAAGAGAAVWSYGGYGTSKAPELAGTLIVADRANAAAKVAAPEARTADLVELDAPAAIAKEGPVSGPARDPSVAPAPLSGGPLQAAIDGAPFRSSILGISTAALPVASEALAPTGSAVSAGAAPSASTGPDDAAAMSPTDAPPGSSLDSGGSDLGATMPSDEAGLPFGGGADEPSGSAGHRESNRSDYIAAFTRDAFRSSATVAAIAGSLKPNTADEADDDLDGPASTSESAASVAADGGAGAADGGGAPAGAGSGSASAGGSTSGSGAQASAADSGQAGGSSKVDNPGSSGSSGGPSAGAGDAASSSSGAQDGGDSDTGNTQGSQGKSDQAGKSKGSGSDGDAHGKQKGGDPHGGGKGSGGQAKGHDKGGKDHGGKGGGGKGHGKG